MAPADRESVHPAKLASLLLQYPSEATRQAATLAARSDVAIEPTRGRRAERLRELCRWYAARELAELEREYVECFDFDKRTSLHLTYHVHGDRRQRGVALLRLKERFRAAGLEPPEDELPDYLPVLLEFWALAGEAAGPELMEEHRVALELVRAALLDRGSPFAEALEAVLDGLPRLGAAKLARVRRLAAEGPPSEEVGLEPFAPPEVMPINEPGAGRPLVGGTGAGR